MHYKAHIVFLPKLFHLKPQFTRNIVVRGKSYIIPKIVELEGKGEASNKVQLAQDSIPAEEKEGTYRRALVKRLYLYQDLEHISFNH